MRKTLYFDNAATTFPKPESVYRAIDAANREYAVGAGRGGYRLARQAARELAETKELLRRLVCAPEEAQVCLAPSVTVALNEIVGGLALEHGDTVYVSPYEHNAVARPLALRAARQDIRVEELPLRTQRQEIDLEQMHVCFSQRPPRAIFCTHVSNVTGYVLPVEEIFAAGKRYGSVNVLDSAQSLGIVRTDVRELSVDLLAFAGHKALYGPVGIGGWINVTGVPLSVVLAGGTGSDSLNLSMPETGELRFEAGSRNIAAAAGLHAALQELLAMERGGVLRSGPTEQELLDRLVAQLARIPGVILYLPPAGRHVGMVSFNMQGYTAEDVGILLDEEFDIAVRTGYHCAPYLHRHLQDKAYGGTVRVGLGRFHTRETVDALVEALKTL